MSDQAVAYFESHKLLSNWNDELEFLGYIVAEAVNPKGIEERGFYLHQAADLPAIIDTLEQDIGRPDGSLRKIMSKKGVKYFRNLMLRAKEIRNAMAHHQAPSEERMKILQDIKKQLSDQFQSIVRILPRAFGIHQIKWFPDAARASPGCHEEAIHLDGDLLAQRQRILDESGNNQQAEVRKNKRSHKATDESRHGHWEAAMASQRRTMQEKERVLANREKQRAQKLQNLDGTYQLTRQLRLRQIKRIQGMMEDEEKEWRFRRMIVLRETVSRTPTYCNISLMLIVCVMISLFWLAGLFICEICNMSKMSVAE